MENNEINNEETEPKTIEVDIEELETILQDSFATIESLEEEMAKISNEFDSIDSTIEQSEDNADTKINPSEDQ